MCILIKSFVLGSIQALWYPSKTDLCTDKFNLLFDTVVGHFINIMKTIFYFFVHPSYLKAGNKSKSKLNIVFIILIQSLTSVNLVIVIPCSLFKSDLRIFKIPFLISCCGYSSYTTEITLILRVFKSVHIEYPDQAFKINKSSHL